MIDDLSTALARLHARDLVREADAGRLARIATCCQPSAVRRQLADAIAWLRHGQLGTGRLDTGRLDTGRLDTGRLDTGRLDTGAAPLTSRGCCA